MHHLWNALGGYEQKEKQKIVKIENKELSVKEVKGGRYLNIWINSWEHQLMVKPEEALIKIIHQITSDIVAFGGDVDSLKKFQKAVGKLTKGALRMMAGVYAGVAGAEVVRELTEGQSENSVKELRKNLQDFISQIRAKDKGSDRKFVIYIDDLDRLEPRIAVQMLELLKNIFSLKHCVFVLAIDYEVVVKGLKDKYGDRSTQNQREHRSFFDKIIQLPFTMPVDNYDIGSYVIDLLKDIDYIKNEEKTEKTRALVNDILEYTIGKNPRSIKRMVNNLSLIKLVLKNVNKSHELLPADKLPLFALVSCQIAYPPIYSLLRKKPDFLNWDDTFAAVQTFKKEEQMDGFQEALDGVSDRTEWDDPWERALFRICYANEDELRNSAGNISRFLSMFDEAPKDDEEKNSWHGFSGEGIPSTKIKELIDVANVTSVATESTQRGTDDWKTPEDKDKARDLWEAIYDSIVDTKTKFTKPATIGVSGTTSRKATKNYAARFFMNQTVPSLSLRINQADDQNVNRRYYKALEKKRDEIEAKLGGKQLDWQGSSKKTLQVVLKADQSLRKIIRDHQNDTPDHTPPKVVWPQVIEFFKENTSEFEKVFEQALTKSQSKKRL
jgi:hypothetical protein